MPPCIHLVIMFFCMVRPSRARAAIDITLTCAIYSNWPHENICATPLPRACHFSAHAQQGYSSLFVCLYVCLSVCLSVNALTARVLISAIQTWYYQNRHDILTRFLTHGICFVQKFCRHLHFHRRRHNIM